MRSPIRIGTVVTTAMMVLLGPAAGIASASGGPVLSWSPTTSPGTYNYGALNAGQTASQAFTLTNSGSKASGALTVTLTGSLALTKTADSCTGTSLGAKKSRKVTVTYAPTAS